MTTDAVARERIRTELSTTLFVEAGAGTGKTTALVARVVEGVTTGALELSHLAAITFTESAAGELRDRLTLALERVGVDPMASDEARSRARTALSHLDDAAITTIHGFAQRLCAEWAPAAGLPPGFEVRDDIAASIAFEVAWRRFLDDWYADATQVDFLQYATLLGCTPTHFRRIADALHAHVDRIRTTEPLSPTLPQLDRAPLLRALGAAVAYLDQCSNTDDKLYLHLLGIARFAEHLAAAADDLDALDLVMRAPKLRATKGRKEAWADKAAVVAACQAADDARTALLAPLRAAVLEQAGQRIAAFVRELAAARVAHGTLEFDDLLRCARDLLRSRPDVRTAIGSRWQLLAIDEFQDTDPLQVDIALLLADAHSEVDPRSNWSALRPTPGRLFVVGDPKQSIYRFRRADLRLYRAVVDQVPGDAVALDRNFRTTEPLLTWVNTVCAALLDTGHPAQAPWRPLAASRPAPPESVGPPVITLGGGRDDLNADPLRALEAETITAAIERIEREGWQVHAADADTWRAARRSDIAILVPTRAPVRSIERACAAHDIPLRIESRSLLWDAPEVRDLLLALRAIDDPSDELAVVGALRSPAFGCSDRMLLEYRRSGGSFDARRAGEHDGPVADALRWITERHNERWWVPINALTERVLRERYAFDVALVAPRARDRWRRLRFVLDQTRAFAANAGGDLRAFLDWADAQAEHRAYVNDAVAPEPDDDAVRLLTAHAAKGLEFPIVILAGWSQSQDDSADAVLWSPIHDGRFEIRIGAKDAGLRTDGYDGLLQSELDELRAERDRLLYVAATRARDHLVVSLFHKAGTTCDAERLQAIITQASDATPNWDESIIKTTATVPGLPDAPSAPIELPGPAWQASRADVLARASRPAVVAATTIAQRAHASEGPEPGEAPPAGDDAPPTWRRGRAGTAIGRAVHAVLQTVPFDAIDACSDLARVHAIAEGVPERADEIARLATSALNAPIVRNAMASARVWREIPVGAPLGATVLEGYIDLCFEGPDGLVVIDYKTDAVSGDAALAAAVERYTPQAAAYAAALETVLGRPVAGCAFVFCRPGSAVEVAVADLPAAIAQVRGLVTAP